MKAREVIDHIVIWMNDYQKQSGTKGFVVGVSGGIDSAVTSTLAALTKQPGAYWLSTGSRYPGRGSGPILLVVNTPTSGIESKKA